MEGGSEGGEGDVDNGGVEQVHKETDDKDHCHYPLVLDRPDSMDHLPRPRVCTTDRSVSVSRSDAYVIRVWPRQRGRLHSANWQQTGGRTIQSVGTVRG